MKEIIYLAVIAICLNFFIELNECKTEKFANSNKRSDDFTIVLTYPYRTESAQSSTLSTVKMSNEELSTDVRMLNKNRNIFHSSFANYYRPVQKLNHKPKYFYLLENMLSNSKSNEDGLTEINAFNLSLADNPIQFLNNQNSTIVNKASSSTQSQSDLINLIGKKNIDILKNLTTFNDPFGSYFNIGNFFLLHLLLYRLISDRIFRS